MKTQLVARQIGKAVVVLGPARLKGPKEDVQERRTSGAKHDGYHIGLLSVAVGPVSTGYEPICPVSTIAGVKELRSKRLSMKTEMWFFRTEPITPLWIEGRPRSTVMCG